MSGQRWQSGESELTMLLFKPLEDQVGHGTRPGHSGAEACVVLLPSMHLTHQAEHVRGPIRVVQLKPFSPDVFDLVREPKKHVASGSRAVVVSDVKDGL